MVSGRVEHHFVSNNLQDSHQSTYRVNHSTETALLKVQHDIVTLLDSNSCAVLLMLDLSAAFNVIDYSILFKRLKFSYSIRGDALCCIESYLNHRYKRAAVHSFHLCQWIFIWIMEYRQGLSLDQSSIAFFQNPYVRSVEDMDCLTIRMLTIPKFTWLSS